jgi:polysaccharide export outer membrane protein
VGRIPISALAGFLLIVQLAACQSYKKIPYFQNISNDTTTAVYKDGILVSAAKVQDITIQSNDILNISIQTIDPEINTVFAPSTSATTANAQAVANTNAANGNTNAIIGYQVDNNGEIELPIAGKIMVAGLTTAQAKEAIRLKAEKYYKDPIVNVQIINFKVTVMGEVQRPGAYLINGERATILDALGQAGDLTIYGMRDNVMLSRKENGQQKVVKFDLTSTDIYQSPYFYLKQGDMIYVTPGKAKANSADGTLTRTYALISSTLALLVVVATRIN